MIEGTLKIHWDNSDAPTDTRMYKVSFVADRRVEEDGRADKEILGEESLLDYLIEIQAASVPLERRAERAEEWVAAVHSEGHLTLPKTPLTDEQFQVFSPA